MKKSFFESIKKIIVSFFLTFLTSFSTITDVAASENFPYSNMVDPYIGNIFDYDTNRNLNPNNKPYSLGNSCGKACVSLSGTATTGPGSRESRRGRSSTVAQRGSIRYSSCRGCGIPTIFKKTEKLKIRDFWFTCGLRKDYVKLVGYGITPRNEAGQRKEIVRPIRDGKVYIYNRGANFSPRVKEKIHRRTQLYFLRVRAAPTPVKDREISKRKQKFFEDKIKEVKDYSSSGNNQKLLIFEEEFGKIIKPNPNYLIKLITIH